MKIAILGGSFNPIHVGHLILADSVCATLGYDKVLFVPTYRPPHKEMAETVSCGDRVEMVRLAIGGDSRFALETCEIERGGVSYTWDTVCFLEEKFKGVLDGKLGVIFGEDLLGDYDKWEHAAELSERADLILAVRPKSQKEKASFENRPTEKYGKKVNAWTRETFPYKHKIVENPKIELSSSEIRRKIAEDGAWRYLVGKEVFEYIKSGGLYGFGKI